MGVKAGSDMLKSFFRCLICASVICAVTMIATSCRTSVPTLGGTIENQAVPSAESPAPSPAGASSGAASSGAVSSASPAAVSSAAASSEEAESACEKQKKKGKSSDGKVVYLTFDDGPSELTLPLLDVLDKYGVKATFFVVNTAGEGEASYLKEIVSRGHAIGVHSATHDYHKIYASSAAFFEDFDKMHQVILNATGVDTKLCRFPGGSVNDYNRSTRKEIISLLRQKGYVYYDWNVSSGDAAVSPTAESVYNNVMKGVHGHKTSVVLMHNSGAKTATLEQLPRLLQTLQDEGYDCETLDPSVDNDPFIF